MSEEKDPEAAKPAQGPRIVFDSQDAPHNRGRRAHNESEVDSRSIGRRSVSRSRSRQDLNRTFSSQSHGIPIGYRTLSIHVSESQHVTDVREEGNLKNVGNEDSEYFAGLALIFAATDYYGIVFFQSDLIDAFIHYSTSGARLMIFM